MNKYLITTAIVGCLASTPVFAGPALMLGLSYTFGGQQSSQMGITGRILSDSSQNTFVGVAGVTYFPATDAWGLDAGVGYNFDNMSINLSYDFLNQGIQVSGGWADLDALEGSL